MESFLCVRCEVQSTELSSNNLFKLSNLVYRFPIPPIPGISIVVFCKENIACMPWKCIHTYSEIFKDIDCRFSKKFSLQRQTSRTTWWMTLSSGASFLLWFVEPLARRSVLQESSMFSLKSQCLEQKFSTTLINLDFDMYNMNGRINVCFQEWSLWAESLVQACST